MPQAIEERERRSSALRLPARLPLVLLLASPSGCSWLAVSGPPPDHAQREFFDCTTSTLAPGIDLALAGVAGLAMLGGIVSDDTSSGQGSRAAAIGVPLGLSAVAVASAFTGFDRTSDCTKAKSELARRIAQRRLEQPPEPASGCRTDVECKGERICVSGSCVDPPPHNAPVPPANGAAPPAAAPTQAPASQPKPPAALPPPLPPPAAPP